MLNNVCHFRNLIELAQFCAELTRQGIAFTVDPGRMDGDYQVTITGY